MGVEEILGNLFYERLEPNNVLSDSESEENFSEEEKEVFDNIHAQFDDLTSGYSTISSSKGDFGIKKPPAPQNQMTMTSKLAMIAKAIQGN